MARGNKGFFFGEPLQLLEQHLPSYLEESKKAKFWVIFFPAWDTAYPALNDDDELQELQDEEEVFKEETDHVKAENALAIQKTSCRKAKLQPLPSTSPRLNELRARNSDHGKLKTWFSNQKTKDKGRKIEPFRVWLGHLANLSGPPHHTRLLWVAWQHPQHGDALRTLYRQKYHVDADEEDGEGEKELEEEDEGEDEDERDTATAGALNRKYTFAKEYLATLSMEEREELRVLDALCSQLQCKGVLTLGEILDGEEGDRSGEVLLLMVTHGELPKHARISFVQWVPVRSKALTQAFADFLVACKKDDD
ncbi:hypothetical protein B0H14DRAFT_3535953 [Mycena olivaceomarginata]|nr:hypothetical protein B0H14DRAFT_3535953 [Mycena olivaceomarginata]